MVIDTETTGLPQRQRQGQTQIQYRDYDECRMVQIAWGCYSSDARLVSEQSFIVKPEGFIIPETASRIHGISTDKALADGVPLVVVLQQFFTALRGVSLVVAHNMSFDHGVISAEICRQCDQYQDPVDPECVRLWETIPKQCTMLLGARVHCPDRRWPKLARLYEILYGTAPLETLHRADADVRVCANVYFRMMNMI